MVRTIRFVQPKRQRMKNEYPTNSRNHRSPGWTGNCAISGSNWTTHNRRYRLYGYRFNLDFPFMKYLLLLTLLLAGCTRSPRNVPVTKEVKTECKTVSVEGYDFDFRFCKLTSANGATTCMQSPLSDASVMVTCEFYEGLK